MNINQFQSGQIVSLEHDTKRLYAEVIQVVVSRKLCWVRPLLLVAFIEEPPVITDLRDASDLLWSINLFRPALDTEVITLLSQIFAKEPKHEPDSDAKQELNQFLQQIWQAQKQKLENKD